MRFVQYLRPNGEKRLMTTDRPEDIEAKVLKLEERGCYFEIEELRNGVIHMDCGLAGEQICSELCNNGPEVPVHVDKLVNAAYSIIFNEQNNAGS